MADNLFIIIIVAGIAGYIFWSTRRAKSGPVLAQAKPEPVVAAPVETSVPPAVETGVSRYLNNLPPAPVLTGVTKYLRNLPKPAPETGVARYLKTLKEPAKPETGVAKYVSSVLAAQTARGAAITLDSLLESIPAPTRATGVTRYLQTINSQ